MAQRAVGTKIQIGATSVAELTEIGGLELSADTIDITTLDAVNAWKSFMQGFKDGGEVSLSGFFNPSDGGQTAMLNAFLNGTTDTYQILFPSALGATWSFSGVCTGFKTGAQLEDAISFEATVKVSGQPTLGMSASANMTALATTATLAPAFAAGTYYYTATTGGTSFTVTPTLAGASFDIYVNGAIFQQGLSSGAASNAIAISGIGTTVDVLILYSQSGKSAKSYEIVVYKNA